MSCHVKNTIVLVLVLLAQSDLQSQGFDWEYSFRRPEYAPQLFGGLSIEYQSAGHSTNARVVDQVRNLQPVVTCVEYSKASGSGWRAGILAEWWSSSTLSVVGKLSYGTLDAEFTADSPPATLFDGKIFQTRYTLSTSLHTANVEALVKTRVGSTHVWAAAGLQTELLVAVDSKLKESVIQPNGYTFPGTNLQSKLLSDKDIVGLRSLVVQPKIQVGYDLDMGKNRYSSLSLGLNIPLANYAEGTNWKIWAIHFQYSLVFGLARF